MKDKYLRAAAEAYANLSDIHSDCYHYLNDGFDSAIQDRLAKAYKQKLSKEIPAKYIDKVIQTALVECQYPLDETSEYAWSGNERIAFSGISKRTWTRHKLSEHVNFILNNMGQNASVARSKIQLQLDGYSEAS